MGGEKPKCMRCTERKITGEGHWPSKWGVQWDRVHPPYTPLKGHPESPTHDSTHTTVPAPTHGPKRKRIGGAVSLARTERSRVTRVRVGVVAGYGVGERA